MDRVYMVVGWFGSDEWNEKCFANKEEADAYCAKLWETRESPLESKPSEYAKGLHKFDVIEYEVH